jgi:hypothetical protein
MVFVYVFIGSFLINLIWENAHAPLYAHHLATKITEKTLTVASLGDAIILTTFALGFFYVPFLRERLWLVIPIGLIVAVAIELYALSVHRWAYNDHMPIIPFLNIGFTPTIQLALTGYIVLSYFFKG